MQKPGFVSTHAGQKAGGKRIDTWIFNHPEHSTIEVIVSLVSNAEGCSFHAAPQNKAQVDKSWSDTDIQKLRTTVENDLAEIALERSRMSWRPALVIDTRPVPSYGAETSIGFAISVSKLYVEADSRASNTGARRVMHDRRMDTVIERGFSETRPDDEFSGFRAESPHAKAVLELGDDDEAKLELIRSTIDAFTRKLALRLGPNQISSGLPSPRDIARMMDEAASEAEGSK
jgi:hypothetical protein